MLPDFDGAVAFVDLGSITAPSLVANTVASTLNIAVQGNDPVSSLIADLANQKLLIILDSCEHLVEMIAPISKSYSALHREFVFWQPVEKYSVPKENMCTGLRH